MDLKINTNHTTYRLYIDLPVDRTITVGKLGTFLFKKGVYIYVGSAKKNIFHRIKRHLKQVKTNRWHIDYVREYGDLFYYETFENKEECTLTSETIQTFNGQCPYRKLGSSDCHCVSHLIYCPDFKSMIPLYHHQINGTDSPENNE